MISKDMKGFAVESEDLAARYLTRHGYTILERNYRVSLGEIDIVAKEGGCLCFVEVKARKAPGYNPLEAVSVAKQRKLTQVAWIYLKEKCHGRLDKSSRFDVVGIYQHEDGRTTVRLIRNAFDAVI